MLTTTAQTVPRTVIAEPNLIIRAEPKTDGKPINSIPFLGSVSVYEEPRLKDTINDQPNEWRLIEYEGTKGYVWGQYLSYRKIPHDSERNKEYRIMYEGAHCGDINYDPNLNWYGLYKTPDEEIYQLQKVEAQLKLIESVSRSNWEKEGFEYGQEYILKTDKEDKSIILIGTKTTLTEGMRKGKENQHGFLFPEQILDMSIAKNITLAIRAKIEAYYDSLSNSITKRYELEVSSSKFQYSQQGRTFYTQDITNCIPFIEGTGRRNALYKNPLLKWYGDIDGDNQVDFIISSALMQDTGGSGVAATLFLSSEAEADEFVSCVDIHIFPSGCNG